MKKFFISDNGCLGLDVETEEIFSLESQREAISRIFIANEPMTIVVDKLGKSYELNVKKDDIIISFYESCFDYPVIVVKSKDWSKNLKNYEKNLQKKKEEWAADKVCSGDCAECVG